METLRQDLRYGFRMLLKKPGFTIVAVFALALGIGANTAIFSVVNGILLKPFPYPESDRLVLVYENNLQKGWTSFSVSPANYVSWREQSKVFESIANFRGTSFNLTGSDEPERVPGALVTANFFPMLRINPILGRTFQDEEDQPGRADVAVISHNLWQRRYGSDPEIIGKTVILNAKSYTVIGVMPPDFTIPGRAEIWAPAAFDADALGSRGAHYTNVIARLKQGVTVEQARQEMAAIAAGLEQQYPDSNKGWGTRVSSLYDEVVGDIRPALLIMLGAVGFVLLIACTNVANLLLAKASTRQKEIAIRTALGAGRLRLIRQLLTESMLLAIVGGILGLLLATWGKDLLVAASPDTIPRLKQITIDRTVLAFTMGVSLLTGILFGLFPALQASKADLNDSLKEGGKGSGGGSRHRLRSMLVITEVMLALVLLIGAGLLIKSFVHLQFVDPGLNPKNLLTLNINLPAGKYKEKAQQDAFFTQALDRIKNLPGVETAAVTNSLPFAGDYLYSIIIEGQAPQASADLPSANHYLVTSNYFQALGIPLKRGRYLTEQDNGDSPKVVLINENMARQFWPNEDPIGKRIRIGYDTGIIHEIVGVVGDVKHYGLESTQTLQVYEPLLQQRRGPTLTFLVKTTTEPTSLTSAVRKEIQTVDKDQPVFGVRSMEEIIDRSLSQRRLSLMLLSIFAAVALVLASVGIYGVMSYSVTQRTHEIGIRMALGAQQNDILRLVVGQGMALALIGILLGLAAAFAVTRVMSSLLFEVSTRDPLIFGLTSAFFIIVALLATYIPARKATKVDPMVALRYE